MAYLLGINPTLRYLGDIEFGELVDQAKIFPYINSQTLPDGSAACIWNNFNGSIDYNHVALVIDAKHNCLYEKSGPDKLDPLQYTSLEKLLLAAETPEYTKIDIVNNFEQPNLGKYATFLDFSKSAPKQNSELEQQISIYHENGNLFDSSSFEGIIKAYKREKTDTPDARFLSLAEGFFT